MTTPLERERLNPAAGRCIHMLAWVGPALVMQTLLRTRCDALLHIDCDLDVGAR